MRMTRVAIILTCLFGPSSGALACPCAEFMSKPAAEIRLIADETVVGESQVALQVGGITCASCSQIVHMALSGVAGVQMVELRATQDPTVLIALVSCDATVAAEALAATTNDLGYPTIVFDEES